MNVLHALILTALLAPGEPSGAPPATAPAEAVARARIRFAAEPLIMCHYYLKSYGPDSVKPRGEGGDLASEASAYAQAGRLLDNPLVMRWFEERVASASDASQLKGVDEKLPASLRSGETSTGVRMLADAIGSAMPKYMAGVYSDELVGINRILVNARKSFLPVEERVEPALMKLMGFQPIDREIVIYTVIRTRGVSSWGLSDKGYFTVVGVYGLSSSALVESALHEATHVLDAMQSYSAGSVLQEVRRGSAAEDREEIEVFLHGLVAFNAGELVKRFVNRGHVHAGVRASAHAAAYRPYMTTYEYIWTAYIDGKLPREEISKKLLEEFAAVRKLEAGA